MVLQASLLLNTGYMSPDFPVFFTVESVKLLVDSKSTKTPSPDIKMYMLERRAIEFFYLISPLHKQVLIPCYKVQD